MKRRHLTKMRLWIHDVDPTTSAFGSKMGDP